MITFAAEAEDAGKRIDVFASENYDELSRSGLKKIIDVGGVTVNDKAVKANYRIKSGDIVTMGDGSSGISVIACNGMMVSRKVMIFTVGF